MTDFTVFPKAQTAPLSEPVVEVSEPEEIAPVPVPPPEAFQELPPSAAVVSAEGVFLSKVRTSPEGVVLGVLEE